MTTTRRIGPWRRWVGAAQAVAFAALPFVRVRGESALRFDVPTLRLHFFGATLWMGEFFVLLLGTLALVFAFLLVTLVWGRVWCGWSCPQTLLSDLTQPLASERARRKGRPLRLAGAWALVAAVSALFAAATLWYFVTPGEFLSRLAAGRLGPVLSWSWAVLGAVLFLDLGFVRASFCASACPYAKLQGVLFDASTLVVAYDQRRDDECIDCGACVRVCPTGIDIRDGLQAACIHCAACVDACLPIMAKRKRPTLVDYFFGEPGAPRRRFRPAVAGLAAATAVAMAGTVAAAVQTGRSSLDLSVALSSQYRPRRTEDGRVVNAYAAALENRGRERVTVHLTLDAGGREAHLRPDEVALAPGEHRAFTVVATVSGGKPGIGSAEVTAEAAGHAPVRARVPFVVPEAP
ncbi:MAG TPA: 4Fe-4S dicluster domain-containing protein [Anaeromyxobacteraceae bacterium]|nr:4Fe-4S dicluster domain-containing protein [Anaeromyxobacteraceae bacterium]